MDLLGRGPGHDSPGSLARPELVARPRLTAMLERETGRKLTLISAPAGFGKTTLLVEWLRELADGEGSVAWLSLDEGDNDPARFLSYLVAALRRTVGEGFGEGVLAALRSPEPPRIEALSAAFINELAALPGELTIVLDDYHVINSEAVHGVLSFLLEHLPEGVHLVISSRIGPPLPLSRLRARNQMAELGAADLPFTIEEAATFLNSVMQLDLPPEPGTPTYWGIRRAASSSPGEPLSSCLTTRARAPSPPSPWLRRTRSPVTSRRRAPRLTRPRNLA